MGDWTLASQWLDDGTQTGKMTFRLWGPDKATITPDHRLAFTSLTRIPPETTLQGARFVSRTANYHEVAPQEELTQSSLEPDAPLWTFTLPRLSSRPRHITDGPKSAFLIAPDGTTQNVECTTLLPDPDYVAPTAHADPAPDEASQRSPKLGLLPKPLSAKIESWFDAAPRALHLENLELAAKVNHLYQRLFKTDQAPFQYDASRPTYSVNVESCEDLGEGFSLHFSEQGAILKASGAGQFYGLIALVQMWHAARVDAEAFAFPKIGQITDEPSHSWRGMHLDVSRQVYSAETVEAFLDCLAWHRFNRCHLHLTDDEGWRFESKAYPRLTDIGAWRGHGLALKPQHGSGIERHGGFFTQEQLKSLIEHAESLHIDMVPEIDIPGHCHAALMALPDLVDPSALSGGSSVQGYVNNALNPGLMESWRFIETILGEVADLFPAPWVHIGGDEVADKAWHGSRAATSWAHAKGYVDAKGELDTMRMQAAMLQFAQNCLTQKGKKTLAWEEAARGGGLDPADAVLMVWIKSEHGPQLASQGYQVIMTPGEAYYLDMAQSEGWNEPGLSWAGTSTPQSCYAFNPTDGFDGASTQLLGIQGCIWSENLVSRQLFNHMVFPRLYAVAESAWSGENKDDWPTFARRASLMPKLAE